MNRPRRPDHILPADGLIVQRDIPFDIPGKQEHVLLYLADGPPQFSLVDLPDIHAVDQDLPLLDVKIPADQIQDGGFARSGGAHKGHLLSGMNHKTHIF